MKVNLSRAPVLNAKLGSGINVVPGNAGNFPKVTAKAAKDNQKQQAGLPVAPIFANNLDFGQTLGTIHDIRDHWRNEDFRPAVMGLNQLLGKQWDMDQWHSELTYMTDRFNDIGGMIEDHDIHGATEMLLGDADRYLNLNDDFRNDLFRVVHSIDAANTAFDRYV